MQKQDPKTWWKDYSGLRLTKETKQNLAPSDTYDKAKTIEHLYRIQDQVIARAQKSGDISEVTEANRFAKNLLKEQNHHRYSK